MDMLVPVPERGRTFTLRRTISFADLDPGGRLRLDAVARLLQDTAIEDVRETGWGAPEHLWFIRRVRIDVQAPFLGDREVEVVTWCSGTAAIAAGRRWSLRGDAGGRIEVDSVWIHLGPDARPARLDGFDVYAESAEGRTVSSRVSLVPPAAEATRLPWPLRATDVDLHGHVNNAAYWQAVEHRLAPGRLDMRRPLRASMDYGEPVDLGDDVALAETLDGDGYRVAFLVGERVKASAQVRPR